MKNIVNIIITALLLLALNSCQKEEFIPNEELFPEYEQRTTLRFNSKECSFDSKERTLRFPIENEIVTNFSPFIEYLAPAKVYFDGKLLKNKSTNCLGKIELNKNYSILIEKNGNAITYQLTFTNLPIIQIIAPNEISDNPKTPAKVTINYKEENRKAEKHYIGIEYRGGTSQLYQKKSYGFSLKKSPNLNGGYSASLLDLKTNNDWILNAMWIDKSRLRNKTSFELWKKMDGNNHFGISGKLVELYINDEHQGLYCLNENINPEFLNLENSSGVLYKAVEWESGATLFKTYSNTVSSSYYWDGWNQKYPKNTTRWEPLRELRNLVVNENDSVFSSNINSKIDMDNFVDYYIFLNLVSGLDNTGKNTFLYKENNQSKFIVIPWDLDGTWGLFWNGDALGDSAVLSNNLFERLINTNTDNFKMKLKQRWSSLRTSMFSTSELKILFNTNFNSIEKQDIIAIENKKWQTNIDYFSEQQYLINWLENRILFLDDYFNNL